MKILAGDRSEVPESLPIGTLIERARRVAGQSQYTLAARLAEESGSESVARDYVARWENGRRIPTPYWREYLSTVLRIPREDLDRAAALALRVRDGRGLEGAVSSAGQEGMTRRSAERTASIVAALEAARGGRLYVEPPNAISAVTAFLGSDQRVFTLTGPPGTGKSRLVQHLASSSIPASVQLHDVATWSAPRVDLAAEVLRYSSEEAGSDPALRLEQLIGAGQLLLVVIDGIANAGQMDLVARQVDSLLRQVTGPGLRFMLVVRTPPNVVLSRYPVLAASLFVRPEAGAHASFELGPWGLPEARRAWNAARDDTAPAFDDLPPTVRRLVRLPLYQRMALSVSGTANGSATGAFALVDECIRSVARLEAGDVESLIMQIADVTSMSAEELPSAFRASQRPEPGSVDGFGRFARVTPGGAPIFEHDVVREFFLAVRVSDALVDLGSVYRAAAALDELAEAAHASATMRGVLEFVGQRVGGAGDSVFPDVLQSSLIDPVVTAPLMVDLAGPDAPWLSRSIVQSLMFRCVRERSLPLALSLLRSPVVRARAGEGMAEWVVDVVRAFGAQVWNACAENLDLSDAQTSGRLLDALDLLRQDDATFLAVHLVRFGGAGVGRLTELLAHEDWRVRAALADAVGASASTSSIAARLVADRDYKVRAAVAAVLPAAQVDEVAVHVGTLLADNNWHVRERALSGLADADQTLVRAMLTSVIGDPAWQSCPAAVGVQLARLGLLREPDLAGEIAREAMEAALFGLLREARCGLLPLPAAVDDDLRDRGRASGRPWLVREAERQEPLLTRQQYRSLRGARAVQVALDVHDIDHAVRVAAAVGPLGVDFVEVGDPLIKRVGLEAVRAVKEACPGVRVVAEMMSADWGRDQVSMAAAAGADAVLLIGPASTASVRAAAEAGLRLGVPVALDVSAAHADAAWVREMESAGVDALAVTTNIDLGVGGPTPLQEAAQIRRWTRLPVLVSGGFSAADRATLSSPEWDVLVIGRSVTEAVEPADALMELYRILGRAQDDGADLSGPGVGAAAEARR